MKYNEVVFKSEVAKLYNGEIKIIGKFKGINYPLLCSDKYGVMSVDKAYILLKHRPCIKSSLNKTTYFMNQLKESYPDIANKITPMSEYKKAKDKMLFQTMYGIVSASPDSLLHGHDVNIRSAVNRKEYFKNQLLFLYDNKYDFKINSTDRHNGRVILICPIHGEQSIDSDGIFLGKGCPQCNREHQISNTFYLIRLFDNDESFFKLGISYLLSNGDVRRFREYRILNYNIEVLYLHTFDDAIQCKEFELQLKRIIRCSLYTPKRWGYINSKETFKDELLPIIKEKLI